MRKAPDNSAQWKSAAFCKAVHFMDVPASAFTHVVAGAELEHRKLPGGGFSVELLQYNLPHSVVCRGFYQPAVLVSGTFAKNAVTIATMLFQDHATIVNGSSVRAGTLQFCSENSKITYRAWPNASWLTLVISRDNLMRFCVENLELAPNLPSEGIVTVEPATEGMANNYPEGLYSLNHTLCAIGCDNGMRLSELMETEILTGVAQFLGAQPRIQRSDRRQLRKCGEIFHDTTKLIMSDPNEVLDLHAMSKASGLSTRTIQRAFQAEFGLSSIEWMRVERLHRVRDDLLNGKQDVPIMRTATRWGFVHLGRFSKHYRDLFGESPSMTVSRRATIQNNLRHMSLGTKVS